jgi:hypothetical protein
MRAEGIPEDEVDAAIDEASDKSRHIPSDAGMLFMGTS